MAAVGREATKKALDSSDPLPSLAARNAINQKIATEIDSRLGRLNYFVPEARGYVSAEDLLNLVNSDHRVDPFLREFVSIYGPLPGRAEGILSFYARNTRIADVLQGEIESRSSEMFVKAIDGRRVPVDCASSGQRAALPLMLTLLEHSQGSHFDEVGSLFIEEPEAHLYPTGQREITRIIADLGGLDRDARPQYIITTHSPYLLTAFNNLIYAGKIVRAKPERKSAVDSVLGDVPVIDPSNVRAYAFESGRVRSIVDPETELILAAELDNVSDDLGGEFDKLMDVDYAEYAA